MRLPQGRVRCLGSRAANAQKTWLTAAPVRRPLPLCPRVVFHYDRCLKITTPDLAIDARHRQPRCFVSHAHADHMARHELALATPETARLYHHRLGKHHRVLEMAYDETIEFAGVRLTAYPAGHCLGSAMLLVENDNESLLYTGDFKLSSSTTAPAARLPNADVLVMECTFGDPQYRLPPRKQTVEQLLQLVQSLLGEGRTPVIHAYALGKSQEVTRILTDAGIGVLQHQTIYAVSRIYEACGVALGDVSEYRAPPPPGKAVVTLPKSTRRFRLAGLTDPVSIGVTGWAVNARTRSRWDVDHVLPLSDHADFDELLEAAARVAPRTIYCTHGPASFAAHLRAAGHEAYPLTEARH